MNPALYSEKHFDENNEPIHAVKIITPECLPQCQRYDVYFYRQLKTVLDSLRIAQFLQLIMNCLAGKILLKFIRSYIINYKHLLTVL
jgi:hypothetical protein